MNTRHSKKSFRISIAQVSLVVVATLTLFMPSHANDVAGDFRSVEFNGFLTMEYEVSNKDAAGKRGTFDLHHFNVTSKYHITSKSRIFAEIEWEHGAAIGGDAVDGQIVLERAWYEYKFSEALAIRAGKFLTPFGKYNLIHDATPTFSSSTIPSSVYGKHARANGATSRLFMKYQAGLQLRGMVSIGLWDTEYWAYISNGRGSAAFERDDNSNKSFGARALISDQDGRLQVGFSAHSDLNSEGGFSAHESAFTSDVTASTGNLLVESEAAWFRLETGANSDVYVNRIGGYLQSEYTLEDRFTPFARIELFDPSRISGADLERRFVAGLNIEASHATYLKAEVHFISFEDNSRSSYRMFLASLAVAF